MSSIEFILHGMRWEDVHVRLTDIGGAILVEKRAGKWPLGRPRWRSEDLKRNKM